MNDQERLDDLIIDGLQIYQRRDMFRFSFDAIALVHFCQFNGNHSYVELGTGTGVIPLIGTSLGARHMTGIDINDTLIELARRSVLHNRKDNAVALICGDYRQMSYKNLQNKPFDGVIVNPPFYDCEGGAAPISEERATALHDRHTTFTDILRSVQSFIKYRGKLWMIYSANRLQYALTHLEQADFQIKRLRFVHGMADKPAKLVLMEAVRQGKPGLILEPPLIVYDKPNAYTKEVASWYE